MLAATITDIDGAGIAVSKDLYIRYHHKLGHNRLLGVIAAAAR